MAAPHLSPLSHIRRAEIRFSSSYSYATCPSRMKKTSPLLSSSSSSSISSEKDKGKAIAASSLPFLLKIHPRGVRRNLRLRCHRRLKQGTLAIVISSSPKTSGDVCIALDEYKQYPEKSKLSSIVACNDRGSTATVLHDVNSNITSLKSPSSKLEYICIPFSR